MATNIGQIATGGAIIKSIQTGSFTFTSGSTAGAGVGTKSATISSVTMNKTIVLVSCVEESHTAGNENAFSPTACAELTSSTNINFNYSVYDTQGSSICYWTAIEFSSGVSVQRGKLTDKTGTSSENVTISSVTTSKSVPIIQCAYSGTIGNSRNNVSAVAAGTLTNSTTLNIKYSGWTNTYNKRITWQVISFT